jgi:hypothetical protein
MNARYGQGYLFAKPLDAHDAAAFLLRNKVPIVMGSEPTASPTIAAA